MLDVTNVLAALAIVGLSTVVYLWVTQPNRTALPPGPKPHWLFGNKIERPYSWRYFERLTKEYGPVTTVWLGRQPLIIVGTYKAAQDLMEKQSGIYSDRPASIVAGQTMSGDMRILLVGYSERWRRLRKALHGRLQPKSAETFQPIQEKATHDHLQDLLRDPANHISHAKRYAASVILTVAYGKTTPTQYTDPEVQNVQKHLERLGLMARPGASVVEGFPFLRYVPGVLRKYQGWHREELHTFSTQLDGVRKKIAAQEPIEPCFGTHIIEKQQEFGLTDSEAAYLAGSLFGAGSDTSAAAISIALMAAACFPEAQKKVQAELDRVVGRQRAPTWDDWQDLVYTEAYSREAFRWRPVSSGGFAHAATEDFVYNGHLIPKGASIVGNHWSIHRDPEVFPNPDSFEPERFLNKVADGSLELKSEKELRHFTYGFGRRICPGQHVATRSLFINIASILWAFNIAKKKDSAGSEIDIDTFAFTDTANSHPLPFQLSITPRFAEIPAMISSMNA